MNTNNKKNTATKSGREQVSFEDAVQFNSLLEQKIIRQYHQSDLEMKKLFPSITDKA